MIRSGTVNTSEFAEVGVFLNQKCSTLCSLRLRGELSGKLKSLKLRKQKEENSHGRYRGQAPRLRVWLIIVVKMAISSDDSFSSGLVRAGSMRHSSRRSSSHNADSSASWIAPPSLEINSAADLARDASRIWAATEVPERSSCLPKTLTSSCFFGSFTNRRITLAA